MKFPFLPLTLALLSVSCLAAPKTPAKTTKKPVAKPKAKPKPTPRPTPRPPVPTPAPTPVAEVPVETGPKTWALLVGVSQYQNGQISALRYPAKDAAGLRDALTAPSVGGLSAKQVLLLTDADATREKIGGAINTFLRPNVKSGDKVIVFLAGHGVAKGVGLKAKSYFLPTDVRGLTTAACETSAVPLRALADDLATLPASQFAVFVDACREDPTPGRGLKANGMSDILSRGIAVVPQNKDALSATFFACSIGQRAFEDEKYGHGVFTNWILEGLKQGAIAQKPDGAVDMGRLSSYVTAKVGEWAKETSASGNFEVTQTPQLAGMGLTQPLVLLNVKRDYSDTPVAASQPKLYVSSSLESAQISINGVRAGIGAVERSVPEGDYTITISAPGYAPVSRSVKALGGYENQVMVNLEPVGGASVGAATAPSDAAADFYRRALEAQEREQYEIAEQGYGAAIAASPRFTAAYEALSELHRLQNRNSDVIADALGLVANAPRSVAPLALLSRAYSEWAVKGAGSGNGAILRPIAGFGAPKDANDAANLARKSAEEALKIDANSPLGHWAQGYALAALDLKGKNKRAALGAWGKAAFLDPTDPNNHLGLGYGIRFYALQLKESEKRAELNRAVLTLSEAVKMRPNFYEVHRELAFCYIALGDNKAALHECKLARANRGAASDANEIAGVDVAMAGLHQQAAQNSTGEVRAANEAASQGYLDEAKETAPDLKIALSILNAAGVSSSLTSYLPSELRPLLDIRGTIESEIRSKIPSIGGFRIPGF